jgi:Transposase
LSAQILLAVIAGFLGLLLATPPTAATLVVVRLAPVEDIPGDSEKPAAAGPPDPGFAREYAPLSPSFLAGSFSPFWRLVSMGGVIGAPGAGRSRGVGIGDDAALVGQPGCSGHVRKPRRKRMQLAAALDVSISKSTICVVDRSDGSVMFETTVATEPDAIAAALKRFADRLHLVGHEAGSLAPWLHRALQKRGLPMVMLETRHAHATLRAQRNKTDKNDARALAQLVRTGWFKAVHLKARRACGCGCC